MKALIALLLMSLPAQAMVCGDIDRVRTQYDDGFRPERFSYLKSLQVWSYESIAHKREAAKISVNPNVVVSNNDLVISWHVARKDCSDLTASQRANSRNWLIARGFTKPRFNSNNGKWYNAK